MNNKGQMAAAAGLGYLLGRSHRMKLALMLGAAGASRALPGGPGALVGRTVKSLRASPELAKLGESVRGELLAAAKAAAVTAASERIDSLNNRLLSTTEDVGGAVGDVTEDVTGTARDVTEDVGGAVGDVGEGIGDVGRDVASAVGLGKARKRSRPSDSDTSQESGADEESSGEPRPANKASAERKRTRADSARKSASSRRSAAASEKGRTTQTRSARTRTAEQR